MDSEEMNLGDYLLVPAARSQKLKDRVHVQPVQLREVKDIIVLYHYLHRARVGRQINYAVTVDGVLEGVITYAYPMVCASIAGVQSDQLIEFARLFLKRNIPHVATCAIGKSLRVIKHDWTERFPQAKEPLLCVSWSDSVYHKGTIYKAANFEWLRRTKPKARGKNRYANTDGNFSGRREMRQDHWHEKDCWIYKFH